MIETKSFFQSRTVWGGIMVVVAAIAGFFGFDFTAASQAETIDLLDQAAGAIDRLVIIAAALYTIYARVVATKKIGK